MTEEDTCENEGNGCQTTCCCGDDINHSGWSGHTPVSMHWWYCEGNCEQPVLDIDSSLALPA